MSSRSESRSGRSHCPYPGCQGGRLPDEIAACKPYLDQQLEIIDPLLIVTLGRFSMARYFPGGKITQIHGKAKFENGRAYYPRFHPAAVLRNPALATPETGEPPSSPWTKSPVAKTGGAGPAARPARGLEAGRRPVRSRPM